MSLLRTLSACLALSVVACGASPNPPALNTSPSVVPAPLEASSTPGVCSPHAVHPAPRDPGRGDRVVVVKTPTVTIAYVANEDHSAIHTIDVDSARELAVTPLTGAPSALVGLEDGRLVAALRDRNEIVVLEPGAAPQDPLSTLCATGVASEPVGLAADGKGQLLATSAFGRTLTVLNAEDLQTVKQVELARDPRAVIVHSGKAFIGHQSSSELSVVDLASFAVTRVDLLSRQEAKGESRGSGGKRAADGALFRGGQVYAMASDSDGRLFVPMVSVDPGEPKVTGSYGSTELSIKPFVGVVDLVAASALKIGVLDVSSWDAPQRLCTLPRAAAVVGHRLFVACAGIDEVLELDGRGDNAAGVVRQRVPVAAGPLGMGVAEDAIVVVSQFAREVGVLRLHDNLKLERVALSRPEESSIDAAYDRGREVFHDSFDLRISREGRACASCHPEGRDDGNTWSSPDGPRQTITLAGRVSGSAPFGWLGKHKTLGAHLQQTITRLGGFGFGSSERDVRDLAALETYLSRLPVPTAAVLDGPSLARVTRGRELFAAEQQGCTTCHPAGRSDHGRHDLGSVAGTGRFDTPSLELVAASAPYFHDGRYRTLDDVLSATDHKMGRVPDSDDRLALIAYMESLASATPSEVQHGRFIPGPALEPLPPAAESEWEVMALDGRRQKLFAEEPAFSLDEIPVVEITPAIDWDRKTHAAPGGELLKDFLFWKDGCAAIPGHAKAYLELDWRSVYMTRALERCVQAPDPDGIEYWAPTVMASTDLLDGKLHFEERRGFMHKLTRELRATQTVVADAVPILNGKAFAFRTKCSQCTIASEREQLVLLWGSLPPRRLPITPGSAAHGSFVHQDVELRIDVTRTASEDAPRIAVGSRSCQRSFSGCG